MMTSDTRAAAVAGSFYPSDPKQLQQQLELFLAQTKPIDSQPKALIVPHAGYMFSGPIAASAYINLIQAAPEIHQIILLGPSHHVYFKGMALPGCTHFQTPLGPVEISQTAIKKIDHLPQISTLPDAHRHEHSLEVQLPFLQYLLNDFLILPLVVGDCSVEDVAQVIAPFWDDKHSLIIISTDLSHYLSYHQAKQQDSDSVKQIQHYDSTLTPEQACGCRALNGLLALANKNNSNITTLDIRNSGDTAGSKDQVVGYGAFLIAQKKTVGLS